MKDLYKPLVSIIIPTYNRGHLIVDTLASIIAQTYQNWECIIVDDGSTDNTNQVVLSLKDDRFQYYYLDHRERSYARNYGLEKARGEYIQFLDSDDLLHGRKLESSVSKLTYAKKQIVITNFKIFNDSKDFFPPYCKLGPSLFTFHRVLYDWNNNINIPIHCGLFSNSVLNNFKFPTKLSYREDWFLWLHVFQQKLDILYIEEHLAFTRFSQVRLETTTDIYNNEKEVLKALRDYIDIDSLINFLLYKIEEKNNALLHFQNSLKNLKNTRSYRLINFVKKSFKM